MQHEQSIRLFNTFLANSWSHLEVNKTEKFGNSNITVCLEWSKEDGVSYNFTIFPRDLVVVNTITSMGVCFMAPYNIHLNVSIITSSCGTHALRNMFEIHYGKPSRIHFICSSALVSHITDVVTRNKL